MAEKVLMIALSPTMEEGTIANWIKNEGDSVSTGDVLCEVETDKATMDYESIQEGTILKILVGEGDSAAVEQPIAIIGEEGEDIDELVKEAKSEAAGAGESGKAAETGEAAGKEGTGAGGAADTTGTGDAGAAGATGAGAAAAGEGAAAGAGAQTGPQVTGPAPEAPTASDGSRVKASPLARVLAEQEGIDLTQVEGSGPAGRVVKRDVEQAKAEGTARAATTAAGAPAGVAPTPALKDETISLSNTRKIIAQRLSESKYSAPHFYETIPIFTETMMSARKQLNAGLDYKVSVNAFLMKFAAEAIKRHPVINSSWQGDSIRRFGSIDIGLAVAQENGLITPIVRDCGSKGIVAIDGELSDLIERARAGRLQPEEYTGATFSISSLGTYGIEEFTAIINPPGSAILAVGQMQKVPVVGENDDISVRMQMKVTLSCDHRVIDGVQAAEFLTELKGMLEYPARVLY